jgi:hypothetical protein
LPFTQNLAARLAVANRDTKRTLGPAHKFGCVILQLARALQLLGNLTDAARCIA